MDTTTNEITIDTTLPTTSAVLTLDIQAVNTETSGDQGEPTTVQLGDGGWVTVWTSSGQDGDGDGVYGQRYRSNGTAVGVEFSINTNWTSDQNNADVAALNDGGWVVTWTSSSQDGDGQGIYAQRYDVNGNAVDMAGNTGGSTEFRVNSHTVSNQFQSSVTALADGGWLVTWISESQGSGSYSLYGQRYDASGTALTVGAADDVSTPSDGVGTEFLIEHNVVSRANTNKVLALNDGGWISFYVQGNSVYSQRYDVNGASVGGETDISLTDRYLLNDIDAVQLVDGGWVVTWSGAAGHSHIYGQRFDSNGTAVGSEFVSSEDATNYQQDPSLTALSDGGWIVVWDRTQTGFDSFGAFGQRYAADGTAVGGNFWLNAPSAAGTQADVTITELNDGSLLATWREDASSGRADNSGQSVVSRRFVTSMVDAGNSVIDGAEAASLTVHGFVDGADAARVVVTVSDGVNPDVVGQATVNGDGFWQLTSLDVRSLNNTNLTFTAVVQDAAGNNSSSAPLTQIIEKTEYVPPLVLDLDGDGFEYLSPSDSGARYDFDGDGIREETAWVGASDALIGYDANGDGLISGREELVLSDYLDGAETDLEGLVAFDSNSNGLFDSADEQWTSFLVWQDANGDGISTSEELQRLDDLGIESISLTSDGNHQVLADGSVIEHGQFVVTYTDGTTGRGADVAFEYRDDVHRQDHTVDASGGALL